MLTISRRVIAAVPEACSSRHGLTDCRAGTAFAALSQAEAVSQAISGVGAGHGRLEVLVAGTGCCEELA